MSNRDLGFSVLGRFLAVECYRDSHQPSPTYRLRAPSADRPHDHADQPGSGSGSRAPARPQHE